MGERFAFYWGLAACIDRIGGFALLLNTSVGTESGSDSGILLAVANVGLLIDIEDGCIGVESLRLTNEAGQTDILCLSIELWEDGRIVQWQ